ncbi:outer membrane protein [Silvibacterium sp.]|uniref:outer membrane protein n=1 Tax=Silvibacterium sp. TaxID=1964179 RepID=UPI0039E2ED25
MALALWLAPALVCAQTTTGQQQQQPDQTQTQTAPSTEIPATEGTQERAEVLRQAQARVKARRKLRIQQIVQDTYTHKYETYFGGGYLRFRPGANLQHINEGGWNVGVTDYLKGKLGVTADFRGYYGTTYTNVNYYQIFSPSISQYTFLAGPTARFYESQHWGWTGHVLAGVGHGNFSTGTGGLDGTLIGLYPDGNSFNMEVGASVDYNLGPGLAIRLTPNYLMTRYGSGTQNNLGFTSGVVYRFGRQ